MSSVASEIYPDHNEPYQVEHGVPVPGKQKLAGEKKQRTSRYPFRSMQPGDSFVMADATVKRATAATNMGRKVHPGSSWKVRAEDTGARVWRVS